MQINTQDPAMAAAFIARLTREIGETYAANCALDIMCEALAAENASLKQHNADLLAKTTSDRDKLAALGAQVDAAARPATRKR